MAIAVEVITVPANIDELIAALVALLDDVRELEAQAGAPTPILQANRARLESLLAQMEDALDMRDFRASMEDAAEHGLIPWTEVRQDLDL